MTSIKASYWYMVLGMQTICSTWQIFTEAMPW